MAKKHHLDTTNISNVIDQYKQVYNINVEEGKSSGNLWKQYKIANNGSTGTLDIYKDKKGLYSYKANNESASKLWEFIYENTFIEEMGVKKYSFTNCSSENFEDILDFLGNENKIDEINTADSSVAKRVKIISPSKDEITLTRYNNGRLLFQGRAFAAARDFYSAATLVLNLENKREEYLGLFENKNDDILDSDFEKVLPDAHDKMSEAMLNVLSSSIILINGKQKLSDYCCYVMSACRVLEGVLKLKFRERRLTINNKRGFKDCFEPGSGTNHRMTLDTATNYIKDGKEQTILTKLYNFLRVHRNPCAHFDIIDEESNLLTYEEAVEITNEAIGLINETYKIMP
ncbi:type II toxin-antitoxin system RnlA family toxin [Plebeiibacterium sediminum]|uniref:Type II toxin-antitoxin system RnlA family toxin n=1 Tax=Plebeiibacterium sediminum TaxID=2992112 RepID=A0AAE3M8U2_9BACT|nr:type II toxin-antitoxin system RnlA family toxin [Plebeiobacterium sediminum]MCW3789359.1 type II toxin-antitoxin system RnlA family toxin [Plebeiobacterium sediminum]